MGGRSVSRNFSWAGNWGFGGAQVKGGWRALADARGSVRVSGLSGPVSGLEEMLEVHHESFVDTKSLGTHHGENAHRFPGNLLLIGDAQDAECAG